MRKQKGITLIALVITIIVLLILAAVSITALTDEDKGVVTKAKQAASKTESAADEEDADIQEIIDYVNSEVCFHETTIRESEYVPNSTGTLELHKKCGSCGEVTDTVSYEGNLTGDVYYYIDNNNTFHVWGNGSMGSYSSSMNVPYYSQRSQISSVKIYDGVTAIGNYAFFNFSSLTIVEIGSDVTAIGSQAFGNCSSLTNVKYYGLNEPTAGSNVFSGCGSLSTVLVPKAYGASSFAGIPVTPDL